MGQSHRIPEAADAGIAGAAGVRLLVVEDDATLSSALVHALRVSGYAAHACESGEAALKNLLQDACDGMVLDVGLPGMDGLELLRQLRREGRGFPVLILTARDSIEDRVSGLMQGADDYMVKPFALDELLARIHVLVRRRAERTAPELKMGRLRMDLLARRTFFDGEPVELPLREWGILKIFLSNRDRILSKDFIMDCLLRSGGDRITSNAIDVYVSRLRSRLQPLGIVIRTVRGFGYLVAEEDGARAGGRNPRSR